MEREDKTFENVFSPKWRKNWRTERSVPCCENFQNVAQSSMLEAGQSRLTTCLPNIGVPVNRSMQPSNKISNEFASFARERELAMSEQFRVGSYLEVYWFLYRIFPFYRPFATRQLNAINSSSSPYLVSLSNVMQYLLQEETDQRHGRYCTYCKREGHAMNACFALYPQLLEDYCQRHIRG